MTAGSAAAMPERMLSVTALPTTRPGRVVIEVVGQVDNFTAPLLEVCLHSQASRSGTSHLVVDLRRVSFLGGAGVRALDGAMQLCRRRGARLSVRCRAGIVPGALQLAAPGRPGVRRSADRPPAEGPRRRRATAAHDSVAVAGSSA